MPVVKLYPVEEVTPQAAPNVTRNVSAAGDLGNFGGNQARDMQVAGAQLEKASDNVANIALRDMQEMNDTRVQDLNNQFIADQQKMLFTSPDAFYRKRGAEAINAAEPATKALTEMQKTYLDQASNRYQRDALSKRLSFHLNDATNGMSRHVSSQAMVWQDAVAKGTILNAQNDAVTNYNDAPRVALQAEGAWKIAYDNTLKATGSPEAAKAQADAARSNTVKPAIIRLASENPTAAQRMFDEASSKGWIDATDAPALAATIKDASIKRKSQDIVSIVNATGGVSPTYNARTGGAESGTDYFIENKIGALGKYQFTPQTYGGTAGRPGLGQQTEWGQGKSQAEIRALLLDPKEGPKRQEELQAKYNEGSLKALSSAGVQVNDLTLYMTHFLGHGAGPEFLKLPDDTPLKPAMVKAHAIPGIGDPAAYTEEVYKANSFLTKVQTVGDLKVIMAQKIGAPMTLANSGSPQKPNLDAMLVRGLEMAGNDPDLRDRVTSAIKTDYATKHAIWTAQIGALEKQAFAHIDAGGTIENLPTQLRAGLDGDSLGKVALYEEKRLEKRKKASAEEAGKNLTDLEMLQQLTTEDVEKQKNNLPEKEYRAWRRRALGEDRTDDPGAYERIQRGIGSRDMKNDIYDTFNAGDIGRESLKTLLEKNAAFVKEGGPPTPYRSESENLKRRLDQGLNGNPIGRELFGRGMKEFDQYVATNPQRDGETEQQFRQRLSEAGEDTIKRYTLLSLGESAAVMPIPAHTTFQRNVTSLPKAEVTERIKAAARDLALKYGQGTITEDQYNTDALVLRRWVDFNNGRAEPTPPPKR